MHILQLFGLILFFSVGNKGYQDLCQYKTIDSYKIGQEITILDINAEDISQLRGSCFQEITLVGAKETEFSVMKAEFGGNAKYEYGDMGTKTGFIHDNMSVSFDSCSTMSSCRTGTWVSQRLHATFKSGVVCLHFEPEMSHRFIGGHVRGGRIQIVVTVRVALCHPANATKGPEGCQPLCNASGALHNCDEDICYSKSMTSHGKLGQKLALLDIDAEEISSLFGPCYMEVKLNGAEESEINLVNAKFGGYHETKYVGLLGMIQEYFEDKMSIKFDLCSFNSSGTPISSMATGLNITFKSDVVCLLFEPEAQFKGLGVHTKGGRILILVTVRDALCKPFKGTKGSECEPRCNASGELHNCDSGTGSVSGVVYRFLLMWWFVQLEFGAVVI